MTQAAAPEIGQPAPNFDMAIPGGGRISRVALLGTRYVLYFYPKADTSGCTVQACGIRDAGPALSGLGVRVIGVSPDPLPPIERFAKKYGLDFTLASDPDHAVCERFGVWAEKSMYGKKYWGAERTSFLIDAAGVIERVWHKVKPADHAGQVLAAIGG